MALEIMAGSAYNSKLAMSGPEMVSAALTRRSLRSTMTFWVMAAAMIVLAAGCGSGNSQPSAQQEQTKPAAPAVPPDIQSAAEQLLGSDTQVLLFGDLAKTGSQQFLAANVLPKTPKNDIVGMIVTRAVIAEKDGDSWTEIFRCDEYLKNKNGYLALTPFEPITGWRLQDEQDPKKGLILYLTPVKGIADQHVLPVGVEWNPEVKRYQSLDRTYEHFLKESPNLSNARSSLR
jgi:hypothetical protein